MRQRVAAVLVASATLATGAGAVAPAEAAAPPPGPGFAELDSSTPGHVTGTVLSDQPYVWVRLAPNAPAVRLDVVDGQARFDLETWGYGSSHGGARVEGIACATAQPSASTCSVVATSPTFEPTDITPQVTWPEDDTIGPGQIAEVTVEDDGGGTLVATFVPEASDGANVATTLSHHGTTELELSDGAGYLWITRCSAEDEYTCSNAGFTAPLEHDLDVRRTLAAVSEGSTRLTYADPDGVVAVGTGDHRGTFTATWWLADPEQPGSQVGPRVTVSGTVDAAGRALLEVDGSDRPWLSDGYYAVRGRLTLDDPDFGRYVDVPIQDAAVHVDVSAPVITGSVQGRDPIYPRIGTERRPASADVSFQGTKLEEFLRAVVRGPGGAVVARPALRRTGSGGYGIHVTWNGRGTDGRIVPNGAYTLALVDSRGLENDFDAIVHVSNARLVTRTFTRTVLASPSMSARFVGRCSTLRRPSLHGWSGSVGLYGGTTCGSRADQGAVVSTTHRLTLPRADSYRIRVTAYGGAARTRPDSRAGLRYLTAGRAWTASTPLPSRVRWHAGSTRTGGRSGTGLVRHDGTFAWGVVIGAGQRYDVGRFRVTASYQVLVP